ncbi:MAG: hypothetical protein LBT10_07975 [Methanobrevibacter sp.]|jgi:hypothetical protein|nr:hypothetical protein [Methanobrevibacter sp.]
MDHSLYDDYKKFEKIMKEYDGTSIIDTSKHSFLAPTTLIPLLCQIREKEINKIRTHDNIMDYIKKILDCEKTDTKIPYTILPKSLKEKSRNDVASSMAKNIDDGYGGFGVRFHIINELTNNIYNHTSFEEGLADQGYTYAQEYPNEEKLDICVMDNGLTIPGSFKKNGISFIDDCDAISKAVSSTSVLKKEDNSRGMGLWTTLKLVVEGNEGSVLIISGKGCLHIKDRKNYKYEILDNSNIFKGTLISLRLNKNQVQNFHYLIGINDFVRYEYNEEMI